MATTRFYTHYQEAAEWRWPNFTPKEIACKSTGELLVNYHAMDCLQKFRSIVGVPFTPNSAYRSEIHNKNVGGAPKSKHRLGVAFDIPIKPNLTREQIHQAAKQAGFLGIGDYNTFVHIDTGPSRYWDYRK